MYIGLSNIQSVFSDYETKLYEKRPAYCICSFCRLENTDTSCQPYTLYLTDRPEQLADLPPVSDLHILLCTFDSEKVLSQSDSTDFFKKISDPEHTNFPVHLLHVKGCTLLKAESLLCDAFNAWCGQGLLSESLLSLLFSERGIQSLVDEAYGVFYNPVMVFDAGYKLIAANWKEAAVSSFGKKIIENGGFSDEEFRLINQEGNIHQKVIHSPLPVAVHHPELGFDQIICTINPEKYTGHIVLSALNHPFGKDDMHFLILLQKAIDQQMKKDEFIRNNRGFHYEYFIRDLLDKKLAVAPHNADNLHYVEKEFHGLLYCIAVETARSSGTLNTRHVRSEFERYFPTAKTLLYNGEIIVLLQKDDRKELTAREQKTLQDICTDHGIFAGLSNCFKNIFELHDFYKQALHAIELGTEACNRPGLFIYRNYCSEHLTNIFLQKESPEIFCHPKLRILIDYDQQHGTHLAESLYAYLLYERNYTLSAEAIFIHRNTMIYRIRKIREMTGIDFDDVQERQYLLLSCEVAKAFWDQKNQEGNG